MGWRGPPVHWDGTTGDRSSRVFSGARASGIMMMTAQMDALGHSQSSWYIRVVESDQRFACPCCQLPTLEEQPPGTFLICPVCWWEDDDAQFGRPDLVGGANGVSLEQARRNYSECGISDPAARRYQRNATDIIFTYWLVGSGWALGNIADGRRGYKMIPTYLSDALGDLIHAVNCVFDTGHAQCSWADEPGEWLWTLVRRDNRLHIQIRRFREWHLGKPLDPHGQTWNRDFQGVAFETECDLCGFASEIERAATRLLSQHTVSQYEAQWHHAFPQSGLEDLRSRIYKKQA